MDTLLRRRWWTFALRTVAVAFFASAVPLLRWDRVAPVPGLVRVRAADLHPGRSARR